MDILVVYTFFNVDLESRPSMIFGMEIGPGGLHVPHLVVIGSEAGHCFHLLFLLRLMLFTHFGDTPEGEIRPPLIFWHNQKEYKKIIFLSSGGTSTVDLVCVMFVQYLSCPSALNFEFTKPLPRQIYYCPCCLFMSWSGITAAISVDSVTKEDDWTGIFHPNKQQTAQAPDLITKVADNIWNFPQPCCV